MDCPKCRNTFNDTVRKPRNLPCGHTMCSPCINELKQQGAVTCPECRVSHAVPEAGYFPIAYAIEELVRTSHLARPVKREALTPLAGPAPKATAGLSKRAQSLLQEQEEKVMAAIHSCQEEQSQLADYLTTLCGWGDRQQRLEDNVQTLMQQSRNAREAVRGEKARAERKQEHVQRRQQDLEEMLQALRTTATQQDAYQIIEDADCLVQQQESPGTEENLGVFPDVQVVATVTRVAETSSAALQAAAAAAASSAAAAAAGKRSLPAACNAAFTIADRLQALLALPQTDKQLPAHPLQAEELLGLTPSARDLLQVGRVFAVQNIEGRVQRARLSLEDGRLHLYSLQDKDLDQQIDTVFLPMRELVPSTPPCEVFLDLAWPGSAARRVVVSLPRDTPRARQMLLLCSGKCGACLTNTRLHAVKLRGRVGESVQGGDYQTGDGKGGAALLSQLGKPGEYETSRQAGAVCGYSGDPARGAQFSIVTRDIPPSSGARSRVFGEVVRGLEVVKQAALHEPITGVIVAECGVLLTQPH